MFLLKTISKPAKFKLTKLKKFSAEGGSASGGKNKKNLRISEVAH